MKRFISITLLLVILVTQTGCWNAREINELAFVLSIALDKSDDGFIITAQIAKPDVYSKTPTGGTGTEKEKPFLLISGKGKTIFEAVRDMAEVSPRRIFWSHIKVIIIGEELARSNVLEIFDFFSRNPELRLRTWIAVTPGEAYKIFEALPLMEKEPARSIEMIIEKVNITGKAYRIMLKDFLENYLDPYNNPVTSRIVLTTENAKPALKLEGAAVFGNTKMIGWLNDDETRGLLWINNQISSSIRVVNCPYDNLPVTLEIKKGKTNIKSFVDDGVPRFTITAETDAKIVEKACLTEFREPQSIKGLEDALAAAVRSDIQSTITAAQSMQSDFLDFSGDLHRKHKNEWKHISEDWTSVFSKSEVDIKVKVKIPEVSLLAKSLTPIDTPGEKIH